MSPASSKSSGGSEGLYRHLFDASPDVLLMLDPGGRVELANRRTFEVLGLDVEGLRGRSLGELLTDRSAFDVMMTGLSDGTDMPEAEVEVRGERGVPMMLDLRPVPDGGGAYVARLRDLREMRALEQEYRNLFASIADAIFIGDPETGQILQANASACALTGYSLGELLGQDYDRVHSSTWPEILGEVAAAGGRLLAGREMRLLGKDGAEVPVEMHLGIVTRGDGEEVYIETLIDITVSKKLEQRVRDLRNEWDSFMRHELRSPLTPILAFSQLLLEDFPEVKANPRMMRYVDSIWQGGKRLERLLDLTREVQQYERGEIPMTPVTGDVYRTLSDAIIDASLGVESGKETASRVRLVRHGEGAIPIRQDPQVLQRALGNLVKNALEHDPGEVRVVVEDRGAEVAVAVHNGGPPIPPERLETIFEKFNTTKRDRKGTGLGTTIARLFVQAHGGRILVQSSAGDGTTFTVVLPKGTG